jgi:hypothetical protein
VLVVSNNACSSFLASVVALHLHGAAAHYGAIRKFLY